VLAEARAWLNGQDRDRQRLFDRLARAHWSGDVTQTRALVARAERLLKGGMPASASEQEVLAAAKRLIATLVPRPTPQPSTAAPTINFQPRRSADRSRRKQRAEREDLAKAKDIIVRLRSKTLSDKERHELLTSLVSWRNPSATGSRFGSGTTWSGGGEGFHPCTTAQHLRRLAAARPELWPRPSEGDRRGDQQGRARAMPPMCTDCTPHSCAGTS